MDSSPLSRKTVILGQGCDNLKRWRLERRPTETREERREETKEGDAIQTYTMSHHVSDNLLSWIPMAIRQVIQPSHWPDLNVSHHVSNNLLGYQWWLDKLFNPHTDPIPICHTMWATTCLVGDWASYSTLTLTRSQCITQLSQNSYQMPQSAHMLLTDCSPMLLCLSNHPRHSWRANSSHKWLAIIVVSITLSSSPKPSLPLSTPSWYCMNQFFLIWSPAAQQNHLSNLSTRATHLFVLLHGMLFTNIQLNDFLGNLAHIFLGKA